MVVRDSYKANKYKFISKNFQLYEFASIGDNGKLYSDEVLYDTDIIDIFEKLFNYLKIDILKVNSGYRTNEHERTLSNSAINGYHTKGMAVDFNCYKDGKVLTAKEIALALEDLGWNHGIGLISKNAIHIDSRPNKYYFNEMNGNRSIGNSFYTYYNVEKVIPYYNEVQKRFSLDKETMDYFMKYKYNSDLLMKLATSK